MATADNAPGAKRPAKSPPREPLTLFTAMALIVGCGIGFWMIKISVGGSRAILEMAAFLAGGLSLVGPPLILWDRRRRRRSFGAGRFLWFSTGMASWLLWPPIIYTRARAIPAQSETAPCYLYGTPLMALYVVLTLLAGGWFRKKRRRAIRLSWYEQFGLLLGLAWACLGVYFLSIFYSDDFRR